VKRRQFYTIRSDGTKHPAIPFYKKGDIDPRTGSSEWERLEAVWRCCYQDPPEKKSAVAASMNVTPPTVSKWIKLYREKKAIGRTVYLSEVKSRSWFKERNPDHLVEKVEEAAKQEAPAIVHKEALFVPKRDLYSFARDVLGYTLLTETTHRPMCDQIQEMLCRLKYHRERGISTQQAALFLWPRNTFKSTIGTTAMPLYAWAEIDPNLRILLDSETQDLSRNQQHAIRMHLEENEAFRQNYGDSWVPVSRKGRQRWGTFHMDVGVRTDYRKKEPSLSCAGIDVVRTGRHYDIIDMDDLHSEKNSQEDKPREKVLEHYRLALSLLEPDGIALMFGTRWNEEDLYGYIVDKEKDHWHIDVKQAIDDDGKLFFPERLTPTFLETMRARQGPQLFAAQYLNMPFSHEESPLDPAWLQLFDHAITEDFLKECNLFATLDPARSTKSNSDRSVWEVWAWDCAGDIWLVDAFADRIHPHRIIERSHAQAVKWSAFGLYDIGVESVAYQEMLRTEWIRFHDQFNRNSGHGKVWFNVVPVTPKKLSKFERVRALQPKAFNKQVHLPRSLPFESESEGKTVNFTDLFVKEWARFPKGKYDDTVDTAAYQLYIGYPPQNGMTLAEDRLRKLDPEYAEYLDLTRGGQGGETRDWYTT
jgi:transposase-like protein